MMKRTRRREERRRAPADSPPGRLRIVASKRKRPGSAEQRSPRAHLRVPARAVENAPRPTIPVPAYEWLSTEDRMFLQFERPNSPMHVGAMLLFERGPLHTTGDGIDVRRIREHIGAQLWAIPRYRQRLHPSPIDGQPVWVDDAHFQLAAHVRTVRLPAPGDSQALQHVANQILSRPLDRRRPLWEMWLVDGLADGGFAVISKIHHCMVDGIAGADLLAVLLAPAPVDFPARAPCWVARPAPPAAQLLRDRALRQAQTVRAMGRGLWQVVRHPSRGAEWAERAAALWQAIGLGARPAPDSPFNRPIGPNRRFVWLATDLSAVKQVKNQLGGTVNDVVLATMAGALRRFLQHRDPDGSLPDLRALIPVSTRTAAEARAMGNHVAAWLMALPVSERDPLRLFARIHAMTAALKGANAALGAELLSAASSTMLNIGMRLVERFRPFNLVVTNVPGPPLPLYLLGARLQRVHPLVPLFPNQGLGVAVLSYSDTLCWGLNADCHVVPDLDVLADALDAAFTELAVAACVDADRPRGLQRIAL